MIMTSAREDAGVVVYAPPLRSCVELICTTTDTSELLSLSMTDEQAVMLYRSLRYLLKSELGLPV